MIEAFLSDLSSADKFWMFVIACATLAIMFGSLLQFLRILVRGYAPKERKESVP